MRNRLLRPLLLLFMICLAATEVVGQAKRKAKPKPPAGELVTDDLPRLLGYLNGTKYVNDYFGLSLSIPGDWLVVNDERMKQITEGSGKLLENESQTKRDQFKQSMERSTTLLGLTKMPAGEPNNASFILVAEVASKGISNAFEALRSLEAHLKGTTFGAEFEGEIQSEKINGTEFGMAKIKNAPRNYKQKIYVVVKKGYALEFILTYQDDSYLSTFNKIMKSVKLK